MRQRLFQLREFCKKGLLASEEVNTSGWSLMENCKTDGNIIVEVNSVTPPSSPEEVQSFKVGTTQLYLSPTKIYDNNFSVLHSISAGMQRWSCANFGLYALFGDGVNKIVKTDIGTYENAPDNIPLANSYCEFNGQLIAGGLATYPTRVAWSKIGNADFTVDISNEAGYKDCEIGVIHTVKQLGDSVIAYGAEGVHLMYPAGVTFGHKTLLRIAIDNEKNVGGCKFEHIFRNSNSGDLWQIIPQQPPKLLGYNSFFGDAPNGIDYIDNMQESHIKYNDITYIYDRNGLHSLKYNANIKLETVWLNFEKAGLKQVSEVFAEFLFASNAKGYIKVGGNTSPEIPFNAVNCIKPFVSGEKFKLGLTADYAKLRLSDLAANVINIDGRFGQGVSL